MEERDDEAHDEMLWMTQTSIEEDDDDNKLLFAGFGSRALGQDGSGNTVRKLGDDVKWCVRWRLLSLSQK